MLTKPLASLSRMDMSIQASPDCRTYISVPNQELAFLQSMVDALDSVARIRTESRTESHSKVLIMHPLSSKAALDDLLRHLSEEIEISYL